MHQGQEDQLAFWCSPPKKITGYFTDYRVNSATSGKKCILIFPAHPTHRLIIPCGVAHAFFDIADVVTRNDMQLFIDPFKTSTNFFDDNLTFSVNVDDAEIPKVSSFGFKLPKEAALFLFETQRSALQNSQAEHLRYLNI